MGARSIHRDSSGRGRPARSTGGRARTAGTSRTGMWSRTDVDYGRALPRTAIPPRCIRAYGPSHSPLTEHAVQLPRIAPERHRLVIRVPVATEVQFDRPAVLADPPFSERANRCRLSRTHVDHAAPRFQKGERRDLTCGFLYRKVIPQLFAARHVECAVAALGCTFELRPQRGRRLTLAVRIKHARPRQRRRALHDGTLDQAPQDVFSKTIRGDR